MLIRATTNILTRLHRFVEFKGIKKIYAAYQAECKRTSERTLAKRYFYDVWRKTMQEGVVDPHTGILFTCRVRKNTQRGFSRCNDCECLRADMRAAKDLVIKKGFFRLLKRHQRGVDLDRSELARVARLCKIDIRHVGVFVDAIDHNKFPLPTTESHSKALSKLHRIKQKLTGVQFFGDDSVLFYQTLPDVVIGGNLTLTILAELFSRDYFRKVTDT